MYCFHLHNGKAPTTLTRSNDASPSEISILALIMADIEMKATDTKAKDDAKQDEKGKEQNVKHVPLTPVAEIKANIVLIERAVSTLEPRFTHRVLRTLTALRKRIDATVLRAAIEQVYTKDVPEKNALLSWIPEGKSTDHSMDVDNNNGPIESATPAVSVPVPEGEIYLRLLILHFLLTSPSTYQRALELSAETVQRMQSLNRRSMDPIAAKIWFAVERAYELGGELADARPLFLAAQRTASLRHDDETQASLINRLLRNYVHYNLYDQADKLVSKTTFPESASSPQFARYHYYLGRIKAVQLNYSAHTNLQQAIRRAA
ncbi:hypothetical protein C0992_008638 [Termitomyces sp. T32_za158]|nr:hypothetical protein C0992_008638 [Termitomyces sp. T32_za158]